MGNWFGFGLDSLPSVDGAIQDVLFQPPSRTYQVMKQLLSENKDVTHVGLYSKNGINVSTIIVRPMSSKKSKSSSKVVIFSHGNASDVWSMISYCKFLAEEFGVTILTYDYPDYGCTISTHSIRPSEASCVECLDTVVKFADQTFRSSSVVLMGQSLGTGVTLSFAAQHPSVTFDIVLVSPFKSVPCVAVDSFSSTSLVNKYRFDSIHNIKHLRGRILVVHGKQDQVVPFEHGVAIYKACLQKTVSPVWIDDAGHNDILMKIPVEALNPFLS